MGKTILPVNLTLDAILFWSGSGQYANKSFVDKLDMWSKVNIPGRRNVTTVMALMGIVDKDLSAEATYQVVKKWAIQHGQASQFGGVSGFKTGSDENEEYYKHVAKAYEIFNKFQAEYDRKRTTEGELKKWDKGDEYYKEISVELNAAINFVDPTKVEQSNKERRQRIAKSIEGKKIHSRLNEKNQALFEKVMSPEIKKRVREHDYMLDILARTIRYGN
jgi:hypothetical protein